MTDFDESQNTDSDQHIQLNKKSNTLSWQEWYSADYRCTETINIIKHTGMYSVVWTFLVYKYTRWANTQDLNDRKMYQQ